MELTVVGNNGTAASGSVQVSDATFGREFNETLVHQVVVAYMARARAGTRAQKTRAEVRGGGAKPWKQKGTGRARAGSIRSPLWRGGGKSFPASPEENFEQKVNRKMYRGAMRSILSELVRQDRLIIVDDFSVEAPKTKELVKKLAGLGLVDVLIVSSSLDDKLYLAARNLPAVAVRDAGRVDPVSLLAHEKVLMTIGAIKQLEEALA